MVGFPIFPSGTSLVFFNALRLVSSRPVDGPIVLFRRWGARNSMGFNPYPFPLVPHLFPSPPLPKAQGLVAFIPCGLRWIISFSVPWSHSVPTLVAPPLLASPPRALLPRVRCFCGSRLQSPQRKYCLRLSSLPGSDCVALGLLC